MWNLSANRVRRAEETGASVAGMTVAEVTVTSAGTTAEVATTTVAARIASLSEAAMKLRLRQKTTTRSL